MKVLMLILSLFFLQEGSFAWLCGSWVIDEGNSREVWVCQGESLRGYGLQADGEGQKVTEQLQILKREDGWHYIARVPDQNEGAAIEFRAVHIGADSLAFENPAHDFPKRITYKKEAEDRMRVTISDMADKKRLFHFKKQ